MIDIDKFVESDGLYVTSLPQGGSFSWRLLSLKEYKVFSNLRNSNQINEYILYDMIFERCFLGNSALIDSGLPAGVTLSIGKFILFLSGDSGADFERQELENVRNAYPYSSLVEFMKRVILRAFPGYTPDKLEYWTKARVFKEFVLAEAVLADGVGYVPLDSSNILTQEEAMNAARKKTKKTKEKGIDFKGENGALSTAMGGDAMGRHLTEMSPAELAQRVRIAKAASGGR
jgi:hypothetical protein